MNNTKLSNAMCLTAGIAILTAGSVGLVGCERSPTSREAERRKDTAEDRARAEKRNIESKADAEKKMIEERKEREKRDAELRKEQEKRDAERLKDTTPR